jgi:hypothetical protein
MYIILFKKQNEKTYSASSIFTGTYTLSEAQAITHSLENHKFSKVK